MSFALVVSPGPPRRGSSETATSRRRGGRGEVFALSARRISAAGACRAGGRWVGRVRRSAGGPCPRAGEPPAPGLPGDAPPARAPSPTSRAWSSIPQRTASASSRLLTPRCRSPSVQPSLEPRSPRLGRPWRFRPLATSFGPSGLHRRALFAPGLCRYGRTATCSKGGG